VPSTIPPKERSIANDTGDANRETRRKFWRENLPRLKYHNPTVPMVVNRHWNTEAESFMTVYMRKPNATTPTTTSIPESSFGGLAKAPAPGPEETAVKINMKMQHSEAILDQFIAATKEEVAEITSLVEQKKQAEVDRSHNKAVRAEKKREEDMLKMARSAITNADE
jgi:large subunit ribosomal protein MRP49